jgi:CheY-like chemotaxis protein
MEVVDSASLAIRSARADHETAARQIVVIDDDELSREVLTLIAMEAGFEVESFASGEEAIPALSAMPKPAVILTDMQMPGISGASLAQQLREVCGEATLLLAMSGSEVAEEKLAAYDEFLLKPFSADDLKTACDRSARQADADFDGSTVILNEAVFANFARSMPAGQVYGLYKMCLDDSAKRLTAMRRAVETGDDVAYRRAAHAIKGGCGMVGALELAKLAAEMEDAGLAAEHDRTPMDHFLTASARLGRMLENKALGIEAGALPSGPKNL